MTGLIDIHAHYTDERYNSEHAGGAEDILRSAFDVSGGVSTIINTATNSENAKMCIEQAKKFENMYVAVGLHPSDLAYVNDPEKEIREIIRLLDNREENKIVAVGEIGLDYYWKPFDKELQKKYFELQLELAQEYGLPAVIHDREAHGDCVETVFKYPNVRGVFHSFSGSAEMAKELVSLGWYISFSGVVTFKNARKTVEAAEIVPLDRILTETDAPYLTPHPFRGTRNNSLYVSYIVEKLAEIKGISVDEMAQTVAENARKLFFTKETF